MRYKPLSPTPLISDHEYLKSILEYNPNTGEWKWLIEMSKYSRWKNYSKEFKNVESIWINNKRYKSYILAWLYMTGNWPILDIDHKDLNHSNNKWLNLREATKSQNHMNKRIQPHNTSGTTGVYFITAENKWKAEIRANKMYINLGSFKLKEDAIKSRKLAEEEYFGEFQPKKGS